ncbi:MAG TPA: HAMP domain-containing sensor histidine kinase [Dehalococcoidia bacterium]|jgi:signal transduction histidine kinase|nr:HAMP domain-containing sensor histidine kinase [Dehalococcoidia bacterium]
MESTQETVSKERDALPGHGARQHTSAILAISADGRISKANQPARRIFGTDIPLEHESLGVVLARAMLGHKTFPEQLQLEMPDEDGQRHEVLLVLSDQEPELARPETPEVERPSVTREESVANVADFIAHELRNHIAITLGLSQLLDTNYEVTAMADRRATLRSIQTEAEHALIVLEGLLKIVESRRKAGVAVGRVPVHSVLRRIIADHKRRHPERIFVMTGEAPVFAAGNSTWMKIALANLLANAEKVTPREQAIQVDLRQEGDRVIVLVLDKGKPLDPSLYNHLWDIYAKGPPPGVEISGSGIGLSICKELVDSMGGRVWAGPRSRGGSAFAVSLRSMLPASRMISTRQAQPQSID